MDMQEEFYHFASKEMIKLLTKEQETLQTIL